MMAEKGRGMGVGRIDLTGQRFSRLTVIRFDHSSRGSMWLCKCDCGNEIIVKCASLRNGHTKSCGCYGRDKQRKRLVTHKLCGTPTYTTWDSMIQRCTNPHNQNYKNYGGRGITVCDRWLHFENFIEDMGLRPPNLTIDRRDSNKGYCKDNCRWITAKRQANNTRKNVNITYKNKTMTVSQWAEELGINRSTLNNRLFRQKWSIEEALTRSVDK